MRNKILLTLFILQQVFAWGQDTTYYDYDMNELSEMKYASYYSILTHELGDTSKSVLTMYYKSGKIKLESNFSGYKDRKLDGKSKHWYENGQLKREIDYKDGKWNGNLLTYWEDGKPKRIDSYVDGELIEGRCLKADGTDTAYYDYIKMPEFPGGVGDLVRYLLKEIKYPEVAKNRRIQGRVSVGFVVNKDGTISYPRIIQSVNEELNPEAIRVISTMPQWQPAMTDGELVSVKFSFPVFFILEK